jgi:hypothetical protein
MRSKDFEYLSESYSLVNENFKHNMILVAMALAGIFGLHNFKEKVLQYENGTPSYGEVNGNKELMRKTLKQIHLYGKLGDRNKDGQLEKYLHEVEHAFPEDHEIQHLIHKIKINNGLR